MLRVGSLGDVMGAWQGVCLVGGNVYDLLVSQSGWGIAYWVQASEAVSCTLVLDLCEATALRLVVQPRGDLIGRVFAIYG